MASKVLLAVFEGERTDVDAHLYQEHTCGAVLNIECEGVEIDFHAKSMESIIQLGEAIVSSATRALAMGRAAS